LKYLRFLLFPISMIYAIIIAIKNLCYRLGFFKAYEIPKKSIVVGNLSMGGTGKSPMVSLLINKLRGEHKITILSRGYGRKSKGFILLNDFDLAQRVGDEPLMYKKKFKDDIQVAVCENRKEGIEKLLKIDQQELFILDDAFQHRKVKAGFSILLTDYSALYCHDFILPVGNLREFKSGVDRANVVVVSKCPEKLSEEQKNKIASELDLIRPKLFFSSIKYDSLQAFGEKQEKLIENVLLVSGIANPRPLADYLSKSYNVSVVNFMDHHNYNIDDIANIHKKFDTFALDKKAIITTEKDFVRLSSNELSKLTCNYPWYYQPITFEIDQEEEFLKLIKTYVRKV
jgi:tetraacyldisaccharide 4'-kinase